jgi:cellulose synthase/poly-beta-1,6-N-acetylglucosamine synthase-like glycosyltransferase
MKSPKISIILPFKKVNRHVRTCISECLKLDYANFDIILLPDGAINERFKKCKAIATGPVFPSIKRNIGAQNTKADFLAFIDSDAYPRRDWLKNAVPLFKDKSVGAVGGPNKVPLDSSSMESLSADVIYSKMCTGSSYPIRRYKKEGTWEFKEIASSNLIVRSSAFNELGGFDVRYLTSEDSKLCWLIRTKLGERVVWYREVVVYHHRRPLFIPHMRRMFVEGRNKAGIFWEVRKILFWPFALPSLFTLGVVMGPIFFLIHPLFIWLYASILALYFLWSVVEAFRIAEHRAFLFPPAVFITHLMYGAGFIHGSLLRRRNTLTTD